MASSLASKPFLGAPKTDGLSGLCSSSDLRTLSSSSVQFVIRQRNPKKLQVQAAGNTTGNHFRVTTFGESHGGGVGCVIDGCPPRMPLSVEDLQGDLDRRRPGQSRITTPRKETDTCRILSGVHEGVTTGTPILVLVPNTDQRGRDYDEMSVAYRPSHADRTYDQKYGIRSVQGGGRSSARETIGRVAAGALAKKILKAFSGTEILAYVSQVHQVVLPQELVDHHTLTLDQIESNIVRCPDPEYAEKMIAAIDVVRVKGQSIGGVVTCIVRNCPPGLGSPVFDKLEAEFAKAVMSLPATKGFEFGSGFAGTFLTGSEHNDEFYLDDQGKIRTRTNRSGGTQGGLSNGEIINMRIAFKPTATIGKKQNTVTRDKKEIELIARGRHDPCVVPRAVPMVEAAIALALVDQLMADFAQCHMFPINPDLQDPVPQPFVGAAEAATLHI
ncbi:chorismate synthase, chloroplastic isoform X1 [Pyrus x bretschneideri]|uniref:chorismate synthase, chloroplastic isoform X1 n=2 Tax=Pyrus x bretschneideri TaxID=225117 RepID=UPI0005108D28|nr:chorismate synthase, chloroplastic isoform X1 [Pyrus x bretschneideri]